MENQNLVLKPGIIPVKRASEELILALVKLGILEITETGIHCVETRK